MWGLKTRTVARKSWIGDFKFAQGDLTFWKFDKIFTHLKCFIFNFGRAQPTSVRRGDWTGLNFAYAVIIEKRIKKQATIIKSTKAEHNTVKKLVLPSS